MEIRHMFKNDQKSISLWLRNCNNGKSKVWIDEFVDIFSDGQSTWYYWSNITPIKEKVAQLVFYLSESTEKFAVLESILSGYKLV